MTVGPSTGPWLVTGASGFLGRHVLQEIQQHPVPRRVVALIRDSEEWRRMDWTGSLDRVELAVGSVTEDDWWSAPAVEHLDGILHLAALVCHDPREAKAVRDTNVSGTLAMVRLAAARRCRLILVSTSGTVGCFESPTESADEDAPHCQDAVRRWPYYRSKIEAEQEARRLAAELGVELVIVRPPVLLGPGDHRYRSTAHVLRFLRGRVPFVIRGGMHFADVRDAAAALVRAMERSSVRAVYHLPGTICTIEEFFALVAAVSGREPPRLVIPFRPARWLASLTRALGTLVRGRPFEFLPEPSLIEMASRYWSIRSRYAEPELGYSSRPGQDTVADTVAWIRAHPPESAAAQSADRWSSRVTASAAKS